MAQGGNPPRRNTHPTRAWDAGETVADHYEITLPAGLPAGSYQVRVGMYALDTLARLLVVDASGQRLEGDYAVVSEFVLER